MLELWGDAECVLEKGTPASGVSAAAVLPCSAERARLWGLISSLL